MAREVSVPYSITASLMPGMRPRQQSGASGCVNTSALRRFSSSITGSKAGSPSHLSR